MLDALRRSARPDDLLALEFRSTEDTHLPKAYLTHFCRYLDQDEVAADLARLGFEVIDAHSGQGLAPHTATLPPHLSEDPHVVRLVARFIG